MGGLADTDLVVEDDWYVEVSVGEDIMMGKPRAAV